MKNQTDYLIDLLSNTDRESTPKVSITVSSDTHKKLKQLCLLLEYDSNPNLSLLTTNIIEIFFVDHKDQLNEIQNRRKITF